MSTIDPIKVQGLKDFQGALKRMDGESQKQLRVALNEAADIVVAGAKPMVPVRTGTARSSIRAQSSQREARVLGGSKKASYYGWLDFGGTVGKGRVPGGAKKRAGGSSGGRAGSVKRPWIGEGRYIYPAFTRNRQKVMEALQEAITKVAHDAGLKVE